MAAKTVPEDLEAAFPMLVDRPGALVRPGAPGTMPREPSTFRSSTLRVGEDITVSKTGVGQKCVWVDGCGPPDQIALHFVTLVRL